MYPERSKQAVRARLIGFKVEIVCGVDLVFNEGFGILRREPKSISSTHYHCSESAEVRVDPHATDTSPLWWHFWGGDVPCGRRNRRGEADGTARKALVPS